MFGLFECFLCSVVGWLLLLMYVARNRSFIITPGVTVLIEMWVV